MQLAGSLSHLLLDQVDPREADEDVAQAGGVRVLLLMKVRGELEVGVHVPRGWGKTEDERKEEVAPIKTLLCFFQPVFYPDQRTDFRSINPGISIAVTFISCESLR